MLDFKFEAEEVIKIKNKKDDEEESKKLEVLVNLKSSIYGMKIFSKIMTYGRVEQ